MTIWGPFPSYSPFGPAPVPPEQFVDPALLPPDVILYGKPNKPAAHTCRNCARLPNCGLIQHSLAQLSDASGGGGVQWPYGPGVLPPQGMALPMPCFGVEWEAKPNQVSEHNPVISRLGLTDVGEPVILKRTADAEDSEDDDSEDDDD